VFDVYASVSVRFTSSARNCSPTGLASDGGLSTDSDLVPIVYKLNCAFITKVGLVMLESEEIFVSSENRTKH